MVTILSNKFKKLFSIIYNCYLCIRYPFLYPRNRFTNKHYNNWKIYDYHLRNYKEAVKYVHIILVHESEFSIKNKQLYQVLNDYSISSQHDNFEIFYKNKSIFKSSKHIDNGFIDAYMLKCGLYPSNDGNVDCYVVLNKEIKDKSIQRFFSINNVVNRWLYFKVKFLDFINDYILQLFHCIPKYTELDALKHGCPGWYKRFGLDMIKEIKKGLKKAKILYSFRITQIKEKYGVLEFYCNYATKEVYEIIEKYRKISETTCIECGNDADVITDGYICPYCNDCYEKYHKLEKIGFKKNNNNEWIEVQTED